MRPFPQSVNLNTARLEVRGVNLDEVGDGSERRGITTAGDNGRRQRAKMDLSASERGYAPALIEDGIKSSEIEGERLDRDQVRSSLARRLGMDIGALAPADRNVEGVVEMILDATQKYNEPLTADRLFGWHAALFPTGRSGMHKIIIGGWRDDRNGPMQVVSGSVGRERVHFEALPATRID